MIEPKIVSLFDNIPNSPSIWAKEKQVFSPLHLSAELALVICRNMAGD
jgi:hypothetical protein